MQELIVVADPDPFNSRLLQEACEGVGYEVRPAADDRQLLDMVARDRPDLLVLDVADPVKGLHVLRILKGDADLATIPVILVTDPENADLCEQGMQLGAADYMLKPFRVFEVQQRVRTVLRLRNASSNRPRDENGQEIVDELTRTGTVQQLRISINYEYMRAVRYGHPLACVVVALANLEKIVRVAGKEGADGALVQLAHGLRRHMREVDHIFRSDLDEFTALLPETDQVGMIAVHERIEQSAIDGSLWGAAIEPIPVLKIGAASHPAAKAKSGADLLRLASEKTYGQARRSMPPI